MESPTTQGPVFRISVGGRIKVKERDRSFRLRGKVTTKRKLRNSPVSDNPVSTVSFVSTDVSSTNPGPRIRPNKLREEVNLVLLIVFVYSTGPRRPQRLEFYLPVPGENNPLVLFPDFSLDL